MHRTFSHFTYRSRLASLLTRETTSIIFSHAKHLSHMFLKALTLNERFGAIKPKKLVPKSDAVAAAGNSKAKRRGEAQQRNADARQANVAGKRGQEQPAAKKKGKGKKAKKAAAKEAERKPVSADDLDKELAQYWKPEDAKSGGKGKKKVEKKPVTQEELDSELGDYFKSDNAENAEVKNEAQ